MEQNFAGKVCLWQNDISNSRAKGLLKNIEVFGIGNVLVLSEEPGKIEEYFTEYFDKILIDAPCSGEGMFRKIKDGESLGRTWTGIFCKDSEKYCHAGCKNVKTGWNDALFYLYI